MVHALFQHGAMRDGGQEAAGWEGPPRLAIEERALRSCRTEGAEANPSNPGIRAGADPSAITLRPCASAPVELGRADALPHGPLEGNGVAGTARRVCRRAAVARSMCSRPYWRSAARWLCARHRILTFSGSEPPPLPRG